MEIRTEDEIKAQPKRPWRINDADRTLLEASARKSEATKPSDFSTDPAKLDQASDC